jgi:hypothetical protein
MSIYIAVEHMQPNMNQALLFFALRICSDMFWKYPLILDGLFSRPPLTPATKEMKCTLIPNFTTSVFEQQKIRFKCLSGRTHALKSEILTTLPSGIYQK